MQIIITLFLILFSYSVFAQKKCKDLLNNANKLYQDGKFQEAVKLCEQCYSTLKTQEEQFEANRLMGISYNFMNNLSKSDYYIERMLQVRPDYQKFPNIDPIEFTKRVNTFEVRPIWFIGIKSGINFTLPSLIQSYSVFNSTQRYYTTIGYQIGALVEYMYKPTLSFSSDLLFNGISIRHEIDNAGGKKQTVNETEQYFLFHFRSTYYYPIYNTIKLTGGVGLGINYMQNASVNFEANGIETPSYIQSSSVVLEERNRAQIVGSIHLGISIPIEIATLDMDMSYLHYFSTTIDPDMRMNNTNFIYNYQYIHDDIKLRSLLLNISLKMPLQWRITRTK